MGKKTLEEIGKILLISFISILLTSITVRRALLDGKLDKDEYYRDKSEHNERHKRENENTNDKLDLIIELAKKNNNEH
jgi:hypothetical protein